MSLDTPPHRAVADLKTWVNGIGCIARKETAYLDHAEDLVCATVQRDSATTWIESLVENGRVFYHEHFAHGANELQPSFPAISKDPRVHVFPISSTRHTVRMLMAFFITILLLSPVIVCNMVHSLSARLIIVTLATSSFVSILSGLTKNSTTELTVAGATYVRFASPTRRFTKTS